MTVTTAALDTACRERLTAARLLAVDAAPYLAHALFAMRPVAAAGLGTFAVDAAWRLYLDPERLLGWSVSEVAGVLVHEAGHLIRDHAGRARDLGPDVHRRRWNYAADAAINDDLERGDITLPEGVVTPANLGLDPNGIEEAYYAALAGHPDADPPPADPGGDSAGGDCAGGDCAGGDDDEGGCGSGAGDPAAAWELPPDAPGAPALSPGRAQVVRRQVAEAVRQAAAAAPGTVPGALDRWAARELTPPTVAWQRVLGSAVRRAVAWRAGASDHTYTRPPRRRLPGIVTPALRAPKVTAAVVLDTSGSIAAATLSAALSEVNGVARAAGIDAAGLTVLSVDSEIAATSRVRRATEVRVAGGGGTDMGVGIAAALKLTPRPDVIVVLTDGYTPWPDHPAGARVIVALLGRHAAPARSVPGWATTVTVPVD